MFLQVLRPDPSAELLDLSPGCLLFEPAPFGRPCRASGSAAFGRVGDAVYHALQAGYGVFAVLFLASTVLCLDNDFARTGDAVITQSKQTILDMAGQGRRRDIEAQVDGTGYLIHILPASAL